MHLIEPYIQRIAELCKRHRVTSLAVFGSVLTDLFRPDSDVDLLVSFDTSEHEQWDYVGNFFDFQAALENLLGRPVDLVVEKALKNKYLIQNLNRTKVKIYG